MAGPFPNDVKLSESLRPMLREILRTRSATALTHQGYTYLQIAERLSALIGSGLVSEQNGRLSLTIKGKKTLFSADKKKRTFFWLDPLDDSRVAKIDLMTPYIPERRSLHWIRHRASS